MLGSKLNHVNKRAPGMSSSRLTVDHLTHWGRVTHICVGKLTIIGSDNGLSPGRRQAIIWTNAGMLLIRPLGTNFNEILIEIHIYFKKIHLKMLSGKWRPFCLCLNVLRHWGWDTVYVSIIESNHCWFIDNGLLPVLCQTIIWIKVLINGSAGTKIHWNFNQQ